MARNKKWHDDYWLLLMQAYLKRPIGVKAVYSREMVTLSLELHIAPQELHSRMEQIGRLETPRIERLYQNYSGDTKRLKRAVELLRAMNGFGNADTFYEGVEVEETFEKDFRPLVEDERLMPAMLIIMLDLYYQLTPATMVAESPEVADTARLLKIPVDLVVDVLFTYQHCDPYLKRPDAFFSSLLLPCQQVWQRFASVEPTEINHIAEELKAYFR